MTFEIHDRENNKESEQHLKENHKKFSNQCLKVLELLRQGKRLTNLNAHSYGILSLPRRILDIKVNGIHIDDQWLYDSEGKRTIKEWYLNFQTDQQKKEITYRKGEKSSSDYSAGLLRAIQQNLFP